MSIILVGIPCISSACNKLTDSLLKAQHYLVHLLREKLAASKARLVFVSSGAVRNVPDPSVLDEDLLAGSGKDSMTSYPQSKFVALLAAHWWRRQLAGQCNVVAVSPGLIPTTGLQRGSKLSFPDAIMKDAKSVPEGRSFCSATFH